MEKIIDYFNNNAFVASIIVLILSSIISLLINRIDRNQNRKETAKNRLRDERINKGEFRIDKYVKGEYNDNLDLFYTDYEKRIIDNKNFECIYDKKVLDAKYKEKIYIPLRNIGKTEICEFSIVVNDKDNCVLFESERIKKAYELKYPNYVIGYYNKILPRESILIELNYYNGSKIISPLSSELSIYYMDGYGNYYEQQLFLSEERVGEPYSIKQKDYSSSTSQLL